MLAGQNRQRAWKPKARTGCKTCKIRKIKCDEEKPSCKRCTSTGRKCDGYDPTFRRPASTASPPPASSDRNGKILLLPQSKAIRLTSPGYLVPVLSFKSKQERDSFDFFTSKAIASLRGYLDSPFWQREVLQAAHRDTAIQHCVIALGAMHRRFFEGSSSHINEEDMNDHYLQFALKQSNQAIQDLLQKQGTNNKMARMDKVTLMTCSILFSSMSCLQGYQKDAFEHLRSGIRLLNEMDSEANDKTEDHPINIESLRSIFVGLDMQARSIMPATQSKNWVARPKAQITAVIPGAELNMPSLLMMLQYLESLLNHMHQFFQSTVSRPLEEAGDVFHEYCELAHHFKTGKAALDTLCSKASSDLNEFTQPIDALQLLMCQIEYFLQCPRPDFEAKWGITGNLDFGTGPFDVEAQFVKIFELATSTLR